MTNGKEHTQTQTQTHIRNQQEQQRQEQPVPKGGRQGALGKVGLTRNVDNGGTNQHIFCVIRKAKTVSCQNFRPGIDTTRSVFHSNVLWWLLVWHCLFAVAHRQQGRDGGPQDGGGGTDPLSTRQESVVQIRKVHAGKVPETSIRLCQGSCPCQQDGVSGTSRHWHCWRAAADGNTLQCVDDIPAQELLPTQTTIRDYYTGNRNSTNVL